MYNIIQYMYGGGYMKEGLGIQLKKGVIEALVLHLLNKQDAYAYSLFSHVSSFIDISESTLYPIFKRLENDRLVKTYSVEVNGRLRKYYSITKDGNQKLNQFINEFKFMKKILDTIILGE